MSNKRPSLTSSWLSRTRSATRKSGMLRKKNNKKIVSTGVVRSKRNESRRSRGSQHSSMMLSRKFSRKVSNTQFKLSASQTLSRTSSRNSMNSRTSTNSEALKNSLQTLFGKDADAQSLNLSFRARSVISSVKSLKNIQTPAVATNFAEVELKFNSQTCCERKGVSMTFLKSLLRRLTKANFSIFTVIETCEVECEESGNPAIKFPTKVTLQKGEVVKIEDEEWQENSIDVVCTNSRVNMENEADKDGIGLYIKKESIKRIEPMDLTLGHILQDILWEDAKEKKVALTETLDEKHKSEKYFFVNCARDAKYSDLIRALLQWQRLMLPEKKDADCFYWIDIFCVNFHVPSAALFLPKYYVLDDDLTTAQEIQEQQQAIHEINEVTSKTKHSLLFCQNIEEPFLNKYTLNMWEVYCITRNSKKIDLLLSTDDELKIKSKILESYDKVLATLGKFEIKEKDEYFNFFKKTITGYIDLHTFEWAVTDKLKLSYLRYLERELLDLEEGLEASLSNKEMIMLRKKIAQTYSSELRLPSRALSHLKTAMKMAKKPKVKVPIMAAFGIVLRETGRLEEAEMCYCELLKQMDRLIGRKKTSTASVLVALGNVYKMRGKFLESQNHFLEALEIRRQAREKKLKTKNEKLINQHSSILECLYALGDCYRLEGDFEISSSYCKEMLEVVENLYTIDKNQYKKAKFFNLHANVLEAQKDYKEAEKYFQICIKLREDHFGKNHPLVAQALCDFGAFLKNRSRTGEAKEIYYRALKIYTALYGEKSPQLSPVKGQLAAVLQLEGNNKEAERLLIEVIKTERRSSNNLMLLSDYLNNLANIYKAYRNLDRAEELLKESLGCVEKSLGNKHPRVGLALWNLAVIQWDRKEAAESKKTWEKAMDIYMQSIGLEHPQAQRCSEWWKTKPTYK